MTNKYVDFVSDDVFLEEVKRVMDSYPNDAQEIPSAIDLKNLNMDLMNLR